MENVKEKANQFNADNIKEDNGKKQSEDNRNEKMIIICLIIISLMLIFASFFFIHDIIDKGRIENDASTTIPEPDNDVLGETTDKDKPSKKPEKEENTIVDNSARFKVKQGESEFSELKELEVFNNKYFNDKSIIAPGVEGDYNFTVENEGDCNFNYDISFTEENPYNVNMVYKLKLNGEYILGNENNWVKGADLYRKNILLEDGKIDLYTIEWKWEDTDYDTEIGVLGGANGAYYKMFINVDAIQVIN